MNVFSAIINAAATYVIALYAFTFILITLGKRDMVRLPDNRKDRLLACALITGIAVAALRGVWL